MKKGALTMLQQPVAAPVVTPKTHISGIGVIFDFGFGHVDRRGKFSGHYSQSDVVDAYGRAAVEELEADNVRLFHVETRKAPGTLQDERLKVAPNTFVPVVFSCDHTDRPALHNKSVVEYSGAHLEKLASVLAESLSEWGRCYVWGHKVSRPVRVEGPAHVRVSPFALGGPHEDDYLARLPALGLCVGRAIGQFLIDRGEGRRVVLSR